MPIEHHFGSAPDGLRNLLTSESGAVQTLVADADFSCLDLRGLKLIGANLTYAIIDDATLVDPQFEALLDEF